MLKNYWGNMKDSIGTLPKITSPTEALNEIIKITFDKRHHFLLKDENDWLELKLKICRLLAKKGLRKYRKKKQ
jgi:hypothetical protein